MAAGSIIVDLLMRTGSFITDTDRAEKRLRQFRQEAISAAAGVATSVGAIAAAVAGGVALLDRFAGTIANYQDLADRIGDAASSVSRLQLAADQSGTALDTVASASQKLTVALSKTDEEGSAASRALAALNIPLEEFKRLSPVEQLERVAKETARYENSAQKTAIAVALLGKAGAELIPFLNDLAETQGKSTGFTEDQIEAADRLTKTLATARSQFTQLGQAILADFLPSLNEGVAKVNAALQSFNGLGDVLARGVAETLKGNVFTQSAADGIDFYNQKLKQLQENRAVIAADAGQESKAGILKDVDEEIARVDRLLAYYKRLDALARPDLGQTDRRELARRGRPAQAFGLGEFNPNSPDKPKKAAADRDTEADRYLQSLQNQLDRANELSAVEQLLADRQRGRLGEVGVLQFEVLRGYAEEIDANKRRKDQFDAESAQLKDLRADRQRLRDEGQRFFEATRTPQEQLNAALAEQSRLLKALGADYQDTYDRAVAAAQKAFAKVDEGQRRSQELARDLGFTFSSAFEDAILSGERFSDVLKSLAQDVLRLVIRQQITQPLALAVSSFFGGGRATGGDVMPGREYLVGENGPEMFVPRTMGAIVPNSGGMGGGPTIIQNITVGDGVSRAQFVAAMNLAREQIKAEVRDDAFRSGRGGAA